MERPPVCIYALLEPGTGEVRYVGRSWNPWARLSAHANKGTLPVREWIASLQQRPECVVLHQVRPDEDASECEARFIALHDGPRLLNQVAPDRFRHHVEPTGVGRQLRTLREAIGMSVQSCARDLGWQRADVLKLEYNRRKFTIRRLDAYARAFSLPHADLYKYSRGELSLDDLFAPLARRAA